MELIFAWVEKYKNLENQLFSFGSKFSITPTMDYAEHTITLDIKVNDSFIEDFFGENIINVSALVGANGVGKSNSIDFLIQLLSNGTEDLNWLAVFYDNAKDKIFIYHTLYDYAFEGNDVEPFDVWSVQIYSVVKYKVEMLNPRLNYFTQVTFDKIPHLEKSKILYYSPFLDFRRLPNMDSEAFNKIVNVSQIELIRNDIDSDSYYDEREQVIRHEYQNLERQFQFIDNNSEFINELNLPTNITVKFHKSQKIDESDLGRNARNFLLNYIDNLREVMGYANSLMEIDNKESIYNFTDGIKLKNKCWFLRNLLENYFFNLEKYTYINDEVTKNIPEEVNFSNLDYIDTLKEFFKRQTLIAQNKFNFNEFVDFILELMNDSTNLNLREDNEAMLWIDVDSARRILKFKNEYAAAFPKKGIEKHTPFMSFSWGTMSSGEKSMLDLFSRLDYGVKQFNIKSSKRDDIVYVLIDEGDNSFHPEWQKKYLSKILKYFQSKHQYKFQIFLTTHSPYIVSDLPRDNVVLLSKNTISLQNLKLKTFGANIHELLAHSFFMGDTLFGDFAYKKINDIFKWASGEIELEHEYAKKLIDLVDEPLLHYKLLQTYYEKIGSNKEEALLKAQIDNLNTQLSKLQQLKNDSN